MWSKFVVWYGDPDGAFQKTFYIIDEKNEIEPLIRAMKFAKQHKWARIDKFSQEVWWETECESE